MPLARYRNGSRTMPDQRRPWLDRNAIIPNGAVLGILLLLMSDWWIFPAWVGGWMSLIGAGLLIRDIFVSWRRV